MKKTTSLRTVFLGCLTFLIAFVLIFTLASCKKDTSLMQDNKLSFNLNAETNSYDFPASGSVAKGTNNTKVLMIVGNKPNESFAIGVYIKGDSVKAGIYNLASSDILSYSRGNSTLNYWFTSATLTITSHANGLLNATFFATLKNINDGTTVLLTNGSATNIHILYQ